MPVDQPSWLPPEQVPSGTFLNSLPERAEQQKRHITFFTAYPRFPQGGLGTRGIRCSGEQTECAATAFPSFNARIAQEQAPPAQSHPPQEVVEAHSQPHDGSNRQNETGRHAMDRAGEFIEKVAPQTTWRAASRRGFSVRRLLPLVCRARARCRDVGCRRCRFMLGYFDPRSLRTKAILPAAPRSRHPAASAATSTACVATSPPLSATASATRSPTHPAAPR